MKKQITMKEVAAQLNAFKTRDELHAYFKSNFAGDENRWIRQEISELLTGTKQQLVKCGLMHLTEYAYTWLQAQPKKSEKKQDIDFNAIVGKLVIRKKCGRKGKVDAYANGKLRITLEDGSVRTPAEHRFKGLYNLQTA